MKCYGGTVGMYRLVCKEVIVDALVYLEGCRVDIECAALKCMVG